MQNSKQRLVLIVSAVLLGVMAVLVIIFYPKIQQRYNLPEEEM